MVIILENKDFFTLGIWNEKKVQELEKYKNKEKKGINGNLITYTGFPSVLFFHIEMLLFS